MSAREKRESVYHDIQKEYGAFFNELYPSKPFDFHQSAFFCLFEKLLHFVSARLLPVPGS
jgi:hypothetical protein